MKLTELSAISPVDGRYRKKVEELAPFFSEFGLIRYRVFIEIEYFIELCQLRVEELSGVNPEVLVLSLVMTLRAAGVFRLLGSPRRVASSTHASV